MLTADRWREVDPYLDKALSLPDGERDAWLAALDAEKPSVAALVRELLGEHREAVAECFLESGSPDAPPESSLAGETVGPYTLVSPIGHGGSSSVWLAERTDGRFDRRVAIKFLSAVHIGRGDERFRREGGMLARLSHPHIAQLIDAGVSPGGSPYLVLEYVDGEPIDRYCERRGLDVRARLLVFLDVLSAVEHAHASSIVHRDIKPSNVLVTSDGQVKLLDFGIGKLLDTDRVGHATMLTREGGIGLTPEYAAPEQLTGSDVSLATDVYALGVLLFVLLTGRHPAGDVRSTAHLVKRVVHDEPSRCSAVVKDEKLRRVLRGDLDTILAKALKKDPRDRYSSVAEMADDLRRYLSDEPISARPDSIAYRSSKFVRRHPAWFAATAGAAVVAASLAITYFVRGGVAPTPNPEIHSLLMLPLDDLSTANDDDYLADGLTERLTTELATIGSLRVISHTTAVQAKREGKPLEQLGSDLGVDAVVEGSIRRTGNRIRLTAQLVQLNPEKPLWSEVYDRDLNDLFNVESDLVESLVRAIQVTLSPDDRARWERRRPVRPEALQAYLRARHYESGAGGVATDRAIEAYKNAVELDPTFTAARGGLARAYIFGLGLQPKVALARARETAIQAAQLDPTSPDVLLASAVAKLYSDRDFAGSEQDFRRAIQADPGNADANFYYSQCLVAMGRFDEAVAAARRAQRLDPWSPLIAHYIGRIQYFGRQYDAALRTLNDALDIDPNYGFTQIVLVTTYEQLHRYNEALEHRQAYLTLSGAPPDEVAALVQLGHRSGYFAFLRRYAEVGQAAVERRGYTTSTDLAQIYALSGDVNQAFRWLQRAVDDETRDLIYLNVEPGFDSMRGDPRFAALTRQVVHSTTAVH
jgi:serine/threonine protein kinase/tetratricopeptide (TPR) repeat protein